MSTEIIIESEQQFHQVLYDHRFNNYYFRGEDHASYPLRPKYGRYQALNAINDLGREMYLLGEFKRRAAPHIQYLPSNDWEWLSVAQHFGLATRLLDWTENPLIAAFFATRGSNPSDRVVYAIDVTQLPVADEAQSPFSIAAPVIYRPKHVASRITAQSGLFTVHSDPVVPFQHPKLERWIIRSTCSSGIWSTLLLYGVHEASVFPDLDGLARFLNIKIVYGITG